MLPGVRWTSCGGKPGPRLGVFPGGLYCPSVLAPGPPSTMAIVDVWSVGSFGPSQQLESGVISLS